ncbi:MAG: hypothetical protein SGPRY_005985, partial [Prymnesium sp.]
MKPRVEAQLILILECNANEKAGRLRHISRKGLLEEVRGLSKPAAGAGPPGAILKARDVRKVDPYFAARLEPVIIVRTGCITLSLGRTDLRAIITRNRLYFVVPDGADSILMHVQDNLAMLRAGDDRAVSDDGSSKAHNSIPFELAALEAMLMTACTSLQHQQALLTERVSKALQGLRRTVSGAQAVASDQQLEIVRELKQQVRELQLQSQALERALERALDEDEDMEAMYLTRLHCSSGSRRLQPDLPYDSLAASPAGQTMASADLSKLQDQRNDDSSLLPVPNVAAVARTFESDAFETEAGHEEVETMLESYVQ